MATLNEDEILDYLEKENQAFRDHWIFRELQCTPEQLFEATREYSEEMGIEINDLTDSDHLPKLKPKTITPQNNFISRQFILRA